MRYLVTAEEMRRYDANTIEKIGIPGMVLMERAALAAYERIRQVTDGKPVSVLIMAGTGNNGGDGLALARLLAEKGYPTDIWCVGDTGKASEQWRIQRGILEYYDVRVCDSAPAREYTILADALFGVGLAREITGRYAEAVEAFNGMAGYKLALDVPSGIDSDTGEVLGCAVRADSTVTFGFAKRGLYLYPGCQYAGEIHVADIGITERSFMDAPPGMLCAENVAEGMPRRDGAGNKGSFGKVLLIAGQKGMAGAAVLAARAAYRVGAGMVKALTAEENRVILQETVPEAMYGTWQELEESAAWADVILIGPGIGKSLQARECLEYVLCKSSLPLVIDADGLNLLAQDAGLQEALAGRKGETILTPHVGELVRLLGEDAAGLDVQEIKRRLWEYGMSLSRRLHAVVAAKDARTFVCQEGQPVWMNILGNSGMATAGSGDVLAGAVAGLLGQFAKQGENAAYKAACQGVLLHAAAGDAAAAAIGENACMAGDIAKMLADVIGRKV